MATLVLTSLATATGATGLAGAALGLGAAVAGSLIDRQLFGGASGGVIHRTNEGSPLNPIPITASTEGAPVTRLWGRARLGGQMIWATRFREVKRTTASAAETSATTSGGKGGGGQTTNSTVVTTTTTFHYYCSFAIAFTCDPAPGEAGSPDQAAGAASQVDAFFGAADAGDFAVAGEVVVWAGAPGEWGYRRMALHYAHLAEAAGGVDGFAIASELVGLTRVRSSASAYPAVGHLVALAGEVAGILDPATIVTYAADWSEYHSHRPDDGTGDVHFNLDPLWASPDIGAVAIDNYLPLADWRDGTTHADHEPGGPVSTYDLDYLRASIAGGEYYDWFYADDAARAVQDRTPINDAAAGKHWVFRNKDISGWWENAHHDRPGGVEAGTPTPWTPEGKPIWFTEFGCPAVDKGANQPNVFVDPKSAESALPHFSTGRRDDLIQRRFLEAHLRHWDPGAGHNPVSGVYGGRMVDTARLFAWTWDARPYPDFPFRAGVWTDAGNHALGHWLNGRLGQVALAVLVREICALVGLNAVDVTGLYGINTTVTGFLAERVMSPRAMLETLMQAFQFDAYESEGTLKFVLHGRASVAVLGEDDLVLGEDETSAYSVTRAEETELPQIVRVGFIDEAQGYAPGTAEGRRITGGSSHVSAVALPVVLGQAYARGLPANAPCDGPDPTRGATRFHRHDEAPDWSRGLVPVALIGHYLFYVG